MDDTADESTQVSAAKEPSESLVDIAKEIGLFAARVEGLEATLSFNMIASIKAREALVEVRDSFFEENGTLLHEDDDAKTYSVPAEHVNEADKNVRILRHFDEGLSALPNSTLVALVSAYDFFLGRLVRWFFDKKPKALEASEKNIGLAELLEFGSIDIAKEYFADREIDALLRESHTRQFDWLEKKIGCTLRESLCLWGEFVEMS